MVHLIFFSFCSIKTTNNFKYDHNHTRRDSKYIHANNIANTNKFDNGISFHNPSPDKLYNFTIPNTFTNNTVFKFEIIYDMQVVVNIDQADDRGECYKFQCSLIIHDADEEELLSNDSHQ